LKIYGISRERKQRRKLADVVLEETK
jgi:hypothetical protein